MVGTIQSASPPQQLDMQTLFDRYHAAWESMDPDRIAALHSTDASFWLQDGSPRIQGRETLRKQYAALFAQYGRLGWDVRRVMFGDRHWVFDYDMLIDMKDRSGDDFTARIAMLDIVDVNDEGEVTRKDVYMDGAARQAALQRAGLA